MDRLIREPSIKNILANREHLSNLGKHLHKLDRVRRITARPDQERIRHIQDGIEYILHDLLKKVEKEDPRFKGVLNYMGSYYDGLKVGAPDEFDFMLVLEELSRDDVLTMAPSTQPVGFGALSFVDESQEKRWPVRAYCPLHELPIYQYIDNAPTLTHSCNGGGEINVLNPFKIQHIFRKLADSVMPKVKLSDEWCHGGCKQPEYSGFRKHGPAILLQFIYADRLGEIKITIDLTLAIKIPKHLNCHDLKMNVHDRFSSVKKHSAILRQCLETDPGMHVIPLYSKLLITEGHASKKYTWRISCSCAEQRLLDSFDNESLLKKTIRVLKMLRDEFLTYHKRKTERKRRKNRKAQVSTGDNGKSTNEGRGRQINPATRATTNGNCQRDINRNIFHDDSSDSDEGRDQGQGNSRIRHQRRTPPKKKTESELTLQQCLLQTHAAECQGHLKEAHVQDKTATSPTHADNLINGESHSNPKSTLLSSDNAFIDAVAIPIGEDELDEYQEPNEDTTDLTEPGEGNLTSSFNKMKVEEYQNRDINVTVPPPPGSGEYYGASHHISSVEIKTMVLSLLVTHMDGIDIDYDSGGNDETLALCVLFCISQFKQLIDESKQIKSLYFDFPLCSALSSARRIDAAKRLDKIIAAECQYAKKECQ